MQGLTFNQVCQIEKLVEAEQIAFSHLADDLIDHICCMIEAECESGLSFDEAFKKAKLQIGNPRNIKKVEENTLLLIDKKYRNMKTTMKVFALISLITIAFGSVFKVMHWPGAGIMIVLGFALLSLVFYPSAISVMKREYKFRGSNVIYPVALISGIALMIGIIFKIQHYPGASILLLLGFFLFIFVLIPSIVISKINTSDSKQLKRTNILGALSLIIILSGVCSKFFHWPGAAIELFIGSLTLSMIWFPLYSYYAFRDSSFIKGGFVYLCIAIIMFNMFNMLLALNISKEVYKDFVQPAITYNTGTDSFEKYNSSLVEIALADSTADTTLLKKINTVHASTGELVSFIRQVKISLISLLDDIPENDAATISKDYYNLQNKFNFDIPTYYLCGTDEEGKSGKGYEIQMKIEAYRNLLQGFVANDKPEADFVGNLLSTSPLASSIDGQNVSWVNYYFYHIPDLGVLNTLTGLEYKIVLAENSVICHLAEHQTEVANQ